MPRTLWNGLLLALLLTISAWAQEKKDHGPKFDFLEGPATGKLGDQAEIKVPEGFVFADGKQTQIIMEKMQNEVTGTEVGFLGPADLDWFIVFEFHDVGYVKDDDKDSLDADKMLAGLKAGTEEANKEREKRGWPKMSVLGWEMAPKYDATSHNLEWATQLECEGKKNVNFNTRLLGRGGVMSVTLVTGPDDLQKTLPKFREVLKDYTFTKGHQYSEWTTGDKIAKYGLTGLVVGGAAAVAAKTGLLKVLLKPFIFVAIAIGAFFKKIFGKKS